MVELSYDDSLLGGLTINNWLERVSCNDGKISIGCVEINKFAKAVRVPLKEWPKDVEWVKGRLVSVSNNSEAIARLSYNDNVSDVQDVIDWLESLKDDKILK